MERQAQFPHAFLSFQPLLFFISLTRPSLPPFPLGSPTPLASSSPSGNPRRTFPCI